MLFEMAIGDAYGIAREFITLDGTEPPNDLTHYHRNPKHPDLGGGRYTDDTQRAIAISEVILRNHIVPNPSYVDYAVAYLDAFHRDPRPGYSSAFYALLQAHQNAAGFLTAIKPFGHTNGAIMGAAPLGYLPTVWAIKEAAYAQAMVTHGPSTFAWAEAIAHMAHFFLYGLGDREQLGEYLSDVVPAMEWMQPQRLFRRDMSASDTTAIVFNILSDQRITSLRDMLHRAVQFGGDTDTYAALVMAIGSCMDIDQTIPETLAEGLENGPYGADFLKSLDGKMTHLLEK